MKNLILMALFFLAFGCGDAADVEEAEQAPRFYNSLRKTYVVEPSYTEQTISISVHLPASHLPGLQSVVLVCEDEYWCVRVLGVTAIQNGRTVHTGGAFNNHYRDEFEVPADLLIGGEVRFDVSMAEVPDPMSLQVWVRYLE